MTSSTTASATPAPAAKAPGARKRILTGDRPTAKSFHLGNYYGTLANRVRLQDDYESYFLIADYHMLTTRIADLEEIGKNIRELVTDYLAVGIDPGRTTIPLGYTVGLLEGLRPCHMDEDAPEAMCLFRLRLPIYPPSQLLQHNGRFCHLTLASL